MDAARLLGHRGVHGRREGIWVSVCLCGGGWPRALLSAEVKLPGEQCFHLGAARHGRLRPGPGGRDGAAGVAAPHCIL